MPVASCPSTSVGADIVMSRCAISVLAGAQWFQAETCLMVDGFYDCMSNIALAGQCPGDYFNVSIEQHSSHIASVLDGFHPIRCKNIQNCSATLNSAAPTEDHPTGTTIDEKCFGPLNSLVFYYYQFVYNMTDFEKCTVFETMLSDAGDCLSVHLPDYCDSSIDEIIQQRKSIYNLTGFDVNMCLEFQPDPCYLFNIVGFMKCGHYSYDSSGHYRYCSCFQTAAPAECNLTGEEIDMHAKDAAERFTGGMIILDCSEDYRCVDSEYMKAEIMPKCQSDRELFYYNTSCESFDIFVNCVLEEMKNQQLECDPDVVKDRLADENDRYLNYDEECKRIRWVSELTFNNETFVQEMYIVSSDAYRNFVQRYSYLISTLLRDFGGGLVKYLRQGSVIMALDYWSVGNPDSRIRRSLESQFSEAMGDIQLGFSYQDADQNKCTDSSYVMDVVSRNCSDELAALQSTSDVCKAFAEVYHCVSDKLRMESHDCSLEIVLSHFLFLGQQTNGTTGLLPPGFDIDNCKTEKCSVWFIEQAAKGECMAPYARLNSTMTPFTTFNSSDEDRCRHYQEFLGCIKYHALINDEECPVAELDELVQKMWGRPGLSMCIGYDEFEREFPDAKPEICYSSVIVYGLDARKPVFGGYDEFESQFPDTKPEICNSSVIVHHLLEYNCLQFNLSVLPDPLDRCRFEYFLRGCVLTSLEKDVGCSMDDVEQVIKREEVRQGLLDSISLDYCAANLRDSQCELDVYSHNNDECFSAPVSLYYLDMFTKVEHLNSSDPNGGKLKCSIFTESLSCLMRSSDANNTCSAIDIAPAVRRSLQITRYLLPESFPGANVSQTNISWRECDDLPDDSLVKSCPPSSVVVDMAVSRCAITVLYATRIFQVDPCMLLDGFKGCLASMVLPETCPENYLQTSLEEYSTYIPSVMDGFDPLKCQYLGNCSQMLYSYTMENQSLSSTIEDRCFGPVDTFVYYFSSQVNLTHYEKCTVFQTLLSDVESCLLKHLPSYCESSIGNIVQQRQQIFMMYGFDMCTEYPPDECSMFGDVVFMRCHQNLVYDDNAGHCRLRNCYHEVAPAECNYTKTDIEYYSNDAYKKYTGYMLPNCAGDEHCFDLDYIDSEIFPKCRDELEVFIDDRNCQNFDEFVTCLLEEMEKLEIKCDSHDLKTRLAEEYYRYMTSYWDYSENCKRIRWVSEIRFNNETFVQNMYVAPSDEYRNFIQRYSYLISTLLSIFDGGQVKYLREGSVIMALGYWSTGDPESRIRQSLESRFSESMEDIELGYTYQDSDQNKCTDSSYVMDVVSRNCSDVVAALESTSDVCKAFTEVYHCVSEQLRMESHECSLDIVLSHFMGHNNDDSSAVLPPDFVINSCRDEKCSSWFIEEAARRECIMSYARLNSPVEATCRHYQEFLGCIKYHALINNEECPVDELDEMVQKMWGRPGLVMCIDHDEFESQFPDTKPEICNSSMIVHHLLEYNCLQFNLSALPDPLDRCRTEYFLRGCVLTTLEKDVGCSMDDVERVIKRQEVRQGLLDSISLDYCAANLPDSQCELEYYSQDNEECLSAAVNLYYLDMFTKVDHLNSSDPNGGKLKCSIFTEGLSCWMRSADANNTCSVQDIAPAVRKSLQTFRYVLPNAYPGANVSQTNISWTECDDIPEESSVRSCPSTSVVVDMIISNCAIQVMYSIRVYQIEPCMMLDRFKYCLDSIVLPETCPENYLQTSLEEYSSYISSVMYGFDPLKCQYIQNCSEMLKSYQPVEDESYTRTIEERCFDPVNTFVYYFSSQVNLTQYEKCTVFQTLLSDAENCVLKHLPNYCDSSVSDIMHERQHSLQMYGFDMCTEYPSDECSMFGDVVFMRCQNIGISDMAGHCRMKSCFQEVAPEKCNFTSSDIDNYASVAYEKYSGSRLPNCTEIDNCFSKVTQESEKCASAIMNITQLNDIQSIYPGSNFSYGQEEECGLLKILSQCIVKTEFEGDETCQSLTWPMVQKYIGESGMIEKLSYPLEQCQGDTIDECESVDLYVLLHCHRFLPYSCNFKRCVEENVSVFPQCSVSQEVGYPERLYNSFTGDNLPNCYGLTVPCELSQCSDVMNATCTFLYCHCDQNTREEENRRLPLCI